MWQKPLSELVQKGQLSEEEDKNEANNLLDQDEDVEEDVTEPIL